MNVNVFEIVKNIKDNAYDSYGMYTRKTFEAAVTAAVKDLDKMDIINLIQAYRTAKEFFELEMTFYRYRSNGGEVVEVGFEQAVVDCWKRANNAPTGRVVGGRRTGGFGL